MHISSTARASFNNYGERAAYPTRATHGLLFRHRGSLTKTRLSLPLRGGFVNIGLSVGLPRTLVIEHCAGIPFSCVHGSSSASWFSDLNTTGSQIRQHQHVIVARPVGSTTLRPASVILGLRLFFFFGEPLVATTKLC